jgi:hypothetical protein
MLDAPPLPHDDSSLLKRRVRYPAEHSRFGEGFVTGHDRATRTVIVLDVVDGSFWRGSDSEVEVIV